MKINLLHIAHERVEAILKPGGFAIDGTIGNGHDLLFLAEQVGSTGQVIGFDVQSQAIQACEKQLKEKGFTERVRLYHESHEKLKERAGNNRPQAVMFNLGYLPGSDKTIVTMPESTLVALRDAASLITENGLLSIMLYSGHPGGQNECEAVKTWCKSLDKNDFKSELIRPETKSPNPPELLLIYKKKT